jgi:hypothetical protein
MYTIKNTTGGCGVKNPIPPGNTGDVLYLVSSGVAGAATDVLYTGSGNLYVANSVTTTNVFAETLNATSTINVTGNIYASNAVTTTNLFAETLNATSTINVTGNIYASNAVTTTNLFANTLNATSTINVTGNIYASNAVTTTNLFANTLNATSTVNVTGNIYASNAITTTNISCAGFTSNVSNTIFNYSTLTIPFIQATTLNVYASANVLTLSIPGSVGQTSLNVTGNIYTSNAVTTTNLFANTLNATSTINVTGNIYASNAVTTTNLFTAGITSNVTSTIFNSDTLTIPFVYSTTLNVASTSNLDVVTITGEPGLTSLNVTGNIYASNAVTTTNIFATNVYASGYVGIRTTSPIEVLDVRGGSISLGTYNSTSSGRYVGYYNGTGGNDCLVGMEIENTTLGGNYSQKLHLRTHWFGNNNGRRLTIDENGNVFVAKNLTTSNPYWFITYSSGGNATYTPTSGSWFSSTANGTIYGNSVTIGGTALTSAFNTTSGTFTFPVAGTYLISVPMFINGAAAGRYAIATFGSSIKPISQYFEFTSTNLPTNEMRTWTFVKQVNGNDTMYLSTPGGSITLYLAETHTTLNIFKVG